MLRFVGAFIVGLFLSSPVWAEYTLVLKNGRRLTVQSYREEGGMVKFQGLGGEIGIVKEQIQMILKSGEEETRGLVLPRTEAPAPGVLVPPDGAEADKKVEKPGDRPEDVEKRLAQERTRGEKEYLKKVEEITNQIRATRERYSLITRGEARPEPGLLQSEEAIKARTDDLISRLRDVQHNPSGPADAGGIKLTAPSQFGGEPPTTIHLRPGTVTPTVDVPPPTYSEKQKELSELRNQLGQLERKRENLIEEMKAKNFDTGSLFLE